MSKKVLVVYYTQSGQLGDIVNTFTKPIIDAGASVEKVLIRPVADYPFPWTGESFFGVMPHCVLGIPTEIEPLVFKETAYDLIIMGYQPWFLSPSIPSNSLLKHPAFISIANNSPVVTISEARNMWLNAFDRVRNLLDAAGAKLVGNVALVDKHPNPISFVTIFYWMLTGKKERFLNIFPKPGVAQQDIDGAHVFGQIVAERLITGNWAGLQQQLGDKQAVKIKYPLMFIEGKAKIIFALWAKFIIKRKNKQAWLSVFKYYLFVALFVGAPILLILDAIFIKPFSSKRIRMKKQHYLMLN